MILGSIDFGTKADVQVAEVLFAKVWIFGGEIPYLCVKHWISNEISPITPSIIESDSIWSDPLNTEADSGGTSGQMKQVLMNKYNAKYA